MEGRYFTDLVNERAAQFVTKSAGKPFFLYVPHLAVHAPFQAPDAPETPFVTRESMLTGSREIERSFYWRMDRSNRKMKAIRHGKYKYLDDGGTMDLLFDLESDPGERPNLHYRHPEISADLKARLKTWEAEMDASDYDMQVR